MDLRDTSCAPHLSCGHNAHVPEPQPPETIPCPRCGEDRYAGHPCDHCGGEG